MAISRFSTSRVTQGLPKYQSAWDQDGVAQGALEPIQTYTGASGAYSFTSIPQTYKHLRLVLFSRSSRAAALDNIAGVVNGLGSSIYSDLQLYTNGSSSFFQKIPAGTYFTTGLIPANTSTEGIFGTSIIEINDYTSTSNFKQLIVRSSADLDSSGQVSFDGNLIQTQQAISSITINPLGGSWMTGTTATLYGIKAG
jgi:hypothetical protein